MLRRSLGARLLTPVFVTCSTNTSVLGLQVTNARVNVRRPGYEASQRVSHLQCDLADQSGPRAHEARRNKINT